MDEATYGRELAPLELIGNSTPKVILTIYRYRCGTTSTDVRVVNLLDRLSD